MQATKNNRLARWLWHLCIGMTLITGVLALDPQLLIGTAHAKSDADRYAAKDREGRRDGECAPPQRKNIGMELGLDAKTAAAVKQILDQQREQHRAQMLAWQKQDQPTRESRKAQRDALRKQTEQKLAKLLSPQQIDKLHQFLPKPPRPPRPPGPPEPPDEPPEEPR